MPRNLVREKSELVAHTLHIGDHVLRFRDVQEAAKMSSREELEFSAATFIAQFPCHPFEVLILLPCEL